MGETWVCCSCNSANIDELASQYCPACGHGRCTYCHDGSIYSTYATLEHAHDHCGTKSEDKDCEHQILSSSLRTVTLATGIESTSMKSTAASPGAAGQPFCASLLPGTTECSYSDVWECCQCKGANTYANSPDCCPVCNHWRCDYCQS